MVVGRGFAHAFSSATECEFPRSAYPTGVEAPVFSERTSVGLDVHARSVVAAATMVSRVRCSGRG